MGKKLKVIGLAFVVVCAFGAASASAQAAIHWNVNGSALASGSEEKVSEAVTVTENPVLTVEGLLRLSCTGIKINEGVIVGTSTDKAKSLSFTGCSVQNTKGETQAKCTVKSEGGTVGTILTTANTSALKEVSGKAYDVFTPASGTLFSTVVIGAVEGGTCGLSGTNKVSGTVALEVPVGTNATTLVGTGSAAIATAAGTSLKYGERNAVLDGKGSLTLASGKTWGVGL